MCIRDRDIPTRMSMLGEPVYREASSVKLILSFVRTDNTIQELSLIHIFWDDKEEKWYFSIVDVVAVLTDSPNPRKYWSVLKLSLIHIYC